MLQTVSTVVMVWFAQASEAIQRTLFDVDWAHVAIDYTLFRRDVQPSYSLPSLLCHDLLAHRVACLMLQTKLQWR